ncbi:uncharacterized protein LOC129927795 isoform X2 [Biomphalaria glabrata]|uniref:Uncharacterized protein LOC129927795 isoform X2 n=1 Tax=Biomphalaria glabrata TaxID=6526 RepID=A0A9W3B6E3_BIOGL|nr:uncharacterized protein LOC129927795 isoform X2 [Biomphalaria glabrata]
MTPFTEYKQSAACSKYVTSLMIPPIIAGKPLYSFLDTMGSKLSRCCSKGKQGEENNNELCNSEDDCKYRIKGDHETQESEGGEADLQRHRGDCKKNPGHREFIPVHTFKLKHLPEDHQDNDLYELIKSTADLTVRVGVTMVSPHRPKFWPGTTQPYPFYKMSDTQSLRTGSGCVCYMNKSQVKDKRNTNYRKCWCRKCQNSDSPSNNWWGVYVITATHVVFDDIEARHTSLRFFYDKDDSPLVSVDKVNVESVSINYDVCFLKCVTCDKNVGNKLFEMWKHYDDVFEKVSRKYFEPRLRLEIDFEVLHPFDRPKQIRIFHLKDEEMSNTDICLPIDCSESTVEDCLDVLEKHLENNLVKNEQFLSDRENQKSEGVEADLYKYIVGSKKNAVNSNFIPVDTFTIKHLPQSYQDIDLYDFIKTKIDMTVRVDVKIDSLNRPKLWPKTTHPYPFNSMSDPINLRTGSGCVWKVHKFQNGIKENGFNGRTDYTKCWCRKCEVSDLPSMVWWEIRVNTSTHVVFDDIEASHATLRFFYDKDDSPVVVVDKVSVVDVNIEHDRCKLKCVTCDTNLGNKLMDMWKNFENAWWKVRNKYTDFSSKHKLNFIVSHPHGCSKQVSVGQWINKQKVSDRRSKFTYTTCTCPGSSGAQVHCVGYNDYFCSGLVHSGSLVFGLNYSGAGWVL